MNRREFVAASLAAVGATVWGAVHRVRESRFPVRFPLRWYNRPVFRKGSCGERQRRRIRSKARGTKAAKANRSGISSRTLSAK